MRLYEFKIIDDGSYLCDPWSDPPVAVRWMPRPYIGAAIAVGPRVMIVTEVDCDIPALLAVEQASYESRKNAPLMARISRFAGFLEF